MPFSRPSGKGEDKFHVDEDRVLDEIGKVFVTGMKRGDRFAVEKSVFIPVLIHF